MNSKNLVKRLEQGAISKAYFGTDKDMVGGLLTDVAELRALCSESRQRLGVLEARITGVPDPAMYEPDKYEAAWLKWRRVALND